ncbi:helix-turn-helix domain-containing protein [Streptomyces albidoflavus]
MLDGTTGVAHVFRQAVLSLAAADRGLGEHDRARLGSTVVDLAGAALAPYEDRRPVLAPETARALLHREITATISRRLHDPSLKPPELARLHSISPRHLHRLFQERGTTVGAFIRAARISRCRRDLADPALYGTPVSAVGARWGFTSASDFTRAFKTATGMTPTDWRAATRTAPEKNERNQGRASNPAP